MATAAAASMTLRFSSFDVTRQAFFRSSLSMGIVNLRPIVDQHVLVIPKRLAPRLADLTQEEIADLFTSVQTIGKRIEQVTNAKSLTVACQDGPFAGQSVPHVHVHILPRHPGDFEPVDQVYDALEKVDISTDQHRAAGREGTTSGPHGKQQGKAVKMDSERSNRTHEEMENEAKWLATLFPEYQ